MPDDKSKQSKHSQRTNDRQRGQSKNGNNNNNNNNTNNNDNNHNQDSKQSAAKNETNTNKTNSACSSLEQFSVRAQEIKNDIYEALEKQSQIQIPDEPVEIVQLKNDILKLSGPSQDTDKVEPDSSPSSSSLPGETIENKHIKESVAAASSAPELKPVALDIGQISPPNKDESIADSNNGTGKPKKSNPAIRSSNVNSSHAEEGGESVHGSFEPLSAKLDQKTKYISLVSSLKKDLEGSPAMIEPICKKLVQMSELISKLQSDCENYSTENKKLLVIKQKLENLCRELQKSNNAIRIESLDLIKLEQGKAKEQTTKIQSTLSGVIKLFDENQQRNMTLRQENQELQTKLRSLLEHCDSWEKGFAAALRQREIEIRLVKTELAKANLLKNEEKERFLKEKQDLLKLLSMMQEHQSRIESQEAKLRLDLSNYASKYDECQDVISKGMLKFQTESKRMLKQIERSKQDYKVLLTKYESSNKRMAQLLDEKQRWDRSMNVSNKKIETLEKLCRALREQKLEQSKGANGMNQQHKNNNTSNSKSSAKKENKLKPTQTAQKEDKQLPDDLSTTGHVDDGSDNGPMVTGGQDNSHMNSEPIVGICE